MLFWSRHDCLLQLCSYEEQWCRKTRLHKKLDFKPVLPNLSRGCTTASVRKSHIGQHSKKFAAQHWHKCTKHAVPLTIHSLQLPKYEDDWRCTVSPVLRVIFSATSVLTTEVSWEEPMIHCHQ